LRFPIKEPMVVSVRIEGKNGFARELSAVLDINAPYCMVLSQDAIVLGYSAAANKPNDHARYYPDEVPSMTGLRGIERGIKVQLKKVSIGPLAATDVDALVFETGLPPKVYFDMILGRTFLKNFKFTVDLKDGKKGYLSLLPSASLRAKKETAVSPRAP
jgi:hypothetical protein